jgi:hypothetical protein
MVFASPIEGALAAASLIALLLFAAAYAGVLSSPRTEPSSIPIININQVADAESLERALEAAVPLPADRRAAARELFAYLVQADGGRRMVPNVGALGRARLPRECGQ